MTSKKKRPSIGKQIIEGLQEAIACERGELKGVRTKTVEPRSQKPASTRSRSNKHRKN